MKEILGRIVAAGLEERRKQGYDVESAAASSGKRPAAVTRCWRFHSAIEAPLTAGLAVRGAGRPGKRDGGV